MNRIGFIPALQVLRMWCGRDESLETKDQRVMKISVRRVDREPTAGVVTIN